MARDDRGRAEPRQRKALASQRRASQFVGWCVPCTEWCGAGPQLSVIVRLILHDSPRESHSASCRLIQVNGSPRVACKHDLVENRARRTGFMPDGGHARHPSLRLLKGDPPMFQPDAVLRNLRRIGHKLRRTSRSPNLLAHWNPFAAPPLVLRPKPIPIPVLRIRER